MSDETDIWAGMLGEALIDIRQLKSEIMTLKFALRECVTESPEGAAFNTGKKTRRLQAINKIVCAALAGEGAVMKNITQYHIQISRETAKEIADMEARIRVLDNRNSDLLLALRDILPYAESESEGLHEHEDCAEEAAEALAAIRRAQALIP